MVDEKSQDEDAGRREAKDLASRIPGDPVGRVLCVGGAVLDTTFLAQRSVVPATSNPAGGSRAFGGVARNVAENLARLGVATTLVSRVGDDENGRALRRHLDGLGIDAESVSVLPGWRTAEYMALLEPDRSLAVGVADMAIFDRLDRDLLNGPMSRFDADWLFMDCNCTPDLVNALLDPSHGFKGKRALDTVSVAKAERLPAALHGVDLLFLNLDEAAAILRLPRAGLRPEDALPLLQTRGAAKIVLTLGAEGLLVAERPDSLTHLPAVTAEVADVTGAGDALVATTLAATLAGVSLPDAARWGCLAATLTLERVGSTRPDLSFALLGRHAGRIPRFEIEANSPEANAH